MLFDKLAATIVALFIVIHHAEAEPLKIGYWTSGYSLGFGAVLEAGQFLEKEGLEVRYIKFGDVRAPAEALLTGDVDIAFAAPATTAFSLGFKAVPVSVILVTQTLEGRAVVRGDSGIKVAKDLAGKKVGMSRPGSSTHALGLALLDGLYGIKPERITVIPGNENELLQRLLSGDIDAAILRNVTIAQAGASELRPIIDIVEDWKQMTKMESPPPLGVALTMRTLVEQRPKDVGAFVKATIAAVKFGAKNTNRVAQILEMTANLPRGDAIAYATLWNTIYVASMTKGDIDALRRENQIFVSSAATEGVAPDSLYNSEPFEAAMR